jgi:hypothetical protein
MQIESMKPCSIPSTSSRRRFLIHDEFVGVAELAVPDVDIGRQHQHGERIIVVVLRGAKRLDPRVDGAQGVLVVCVLDDGDDEERVVAEEPAVARVLVVRVVHLRLERGDHRLAGARRPDVPT